MSFLAEFYKMGIATDSFGIFLHFLGEWKNTCTTDDLYELESRSFTVYWIFDYSKYYVEYVYF